MAVKPTASGICTVSHRHHRHPTMTTMRSMTRQKRALNCQIVNTRMVSFLLMRSRQGLKSEAYSFSTAIRPVVDMRLTLRFSMDLTGKLRGELHRKACGSVADVFHGFLEDGTTVAVKRARFMHDSTLMRQEFGKVRYSPIYIPIR